MLANRRSPLCWFVDTAAERFVPRSGAGEKLKVPMPLAAIDAILPGVCVGQAFPGEGSTSANASSLWPVYSGIRACQHAPGTAEVQTSGRSAMEQGAPAAGGFTERQTAKTMSAIKQQATGTGTRIYPLSRKRHHA